MNFRTIYNELVNNPKASIVQEGHLFYLEDQSYLYPSKKIETRFDSTTFWALRKRDVIVKVCSFDGLQVYKLKKREF